MKVEKKKREEEEKLPCQFHRLEIKRGVCATGTEQAGGMRMCGVHGAYGKTTQLHKGSKREWSATWWKGIQIRAIKELGN